MCSLSILIWQGQGCLAIFIQRWDPSRSCDWKPKTCTKQGYCGAGVNQRRSGSLPGQMKKSSLQRFYIYLLMCPESLFRKQKAGLQLFIDVYLSSPYLDSLRQPTLTSISVVELYLFTCPTKIPILCHTLSNTDRTSSVLEFPFQFGGTGRS